MASVEIAGPFKIYTNSFKIKAKGRTAPVTGEQITPVVAQASSSHPQAGAAGMVDRQGLQDKDNDGLPEHDTDVQHMWLSDKGQTAGWVEFDLGKTRKLDLIQLWNFNEKWHTRRGVKKADISIWTQDAGWQKMFDDFKLEEAEGSEDYDEPVLAKLDGIQAQKIRLDDLVNLGDTDHIGLGEVQFFEVRGPRAVRPRPADGADAVELHDITLSWTPGIGAVAHHVHFGTDPDAIELLGKVEDASTAKLSGLAQDTTYYWRIDEVQSDGSSAQGKVWSFRTGGLVTWWKFDEGSGSTAADSAGGNHGTLNNMGDGNWISGKTGSALDFDGLDDYVDVGDDPSIQRDVFSLAAWIKASELGTGWQSIISFESGSHAVSLLSNGHIHYGWQGIKRGGEGTTDLRTGQWVFVAVTRDPNDQACIYVNGELEKSFACDVYSSFSHPAKIGGDTIDNEYFKGAIDDVRFFNYALGKTEIAALYSGKVLPAVAKVTLETPHGDIPSIATAEKEPTPSKSWIAVFMVVMVVAAAAAAGVAAFATRKGKNQ